MWTRSNPGRTLDIATFLDEVAEAFDARPSIETGLMALCHALQLAYRSAGAILAIARCAGWIDRACDGAEAATVMLRPRARYLVNYRVQRALLERRSYGLVLIEKAGLRVSLFEYLPHTWPGG